MPNALAHGGSLFLGSSSVFPPGIAVGLSLAETNKYLAKIQHVSLHAHSLTLCVMYLLHAEQESARTSERTYAREKKFK